jgi:hypothetical protein
METSERYMAIARRWFTEGWTGNLAMADDIFSENLRANGVHVGVAGPVARIRDWLTGFPDVPTSIEDMFVAGDKLAVTLLWRGTHTGPTAAWRRPAGPSRCATRRSGSSGAARSPKS